MDKQKQIEEMAILDCHRVPKCEKCADCGFNSPRMCDSYRMATALFEDGYRKTHEDMVVLTREEQQHYAAYKIIEPQIRGCLDRERKLIQVVKNAIKNMEVWGEYEHERLLEILGISEEEYTEIKGRAYGSDEEDDCEDDWEYLKDE